MSRWLDLATQSELNGNSLTDNQQEPAKRGEAAGMGGFLMVSAGCRGEKTEQGDQWPDEAASNVISLKEWVSKPTGRKGGAA
jgi:hypothetical protein